MSRNGRWPSFSIVNLFPYKYPNISQTLPFFIPTCPWRLNRQSVPKCRHIKLRCREITQKKAYNIWNTAKVWNQEYYSSMGRKLQDTFDYSKNSASRKPNSSPPLLSSFTAVITTPYLTSYSSITTSTLKLPIESIDVPVLPYLRKGYITTNENLITHLENC